jgi:hypothetical protein
VLIFQSPKAYECDVFAFVDFEVDAFEYVNYFVSKDEIALNVGDFDERTRHDGMQFFKGLKV